MRDKKLTKKKIKHLLSGHFHISKLSTLSEDKKHFIDFFVIKSRGYVFTTPSGEWKFETIERAKLAIPGIKQSLKNPGLLET